MATQAVATIAMSFSLTARSFLISGPTFTVKNASKKNLIPWLIRVVDPKRNRLTSNTPEEIENILNGTGRAADTNKIQKSHLAYRNCILLKNSSENPGI
jgi:hypothetical protein